MNSSSLPNIRSTKPALELISLATMSPELARKTVRELLLKSPDYFGNITSNSFKAVLRIQQDTAYECIGHVGYSPSLEHLHATVHLSQGSGYSLAECASKEFVRFYLSYDEGVSWFDQGMDSTVVRNEFRSIPRQLTISVGISPALTQCFLDCLPLVRTMLSWNSPPPADAPDWIPMWGDVLDARIRPEQAESLSENPKPDHLSNLEVGWSSI